MLAIYIRLSREDEESNSIENQLREGKAFAKKHNYKYVVYNEGQGISGKADISKRPQFYKMLSDIDKGLIKAVWARNQNRLERNRYTFAKFLKSLIDNDARLFYQDREYDLNDPSVKLQLGLLSEINEYKVNSQSYDTRRAIQDNYKEGKSHGSIPFGYDVDRGNFLIPHKENAPIVEMIFKWSAGGDSVKTIAKKLNNLGVKTGRGNKWGKSSLQKMLHLTTYIGKRPYLDTHTTAPTLISEELFERSLETMDKNATDKGARNSTRFWLNGLIECDNCGNRYLGAQAKYGRYECATRRDKRGCTSKHVGSTFLHDLVWYVMVFELPEEVNNISNNDEQREQIQNEVQRLREEHSKLASQYLKHAEMEVKDELPPHVLKQVYDRIKNDDKRLKREIREQEHELEGFENPDLSEIITLSNSTSTPNTLRKEIANKFIRNIDIYGMDDLMRVDITFKVHNIKMSYYIDTKKGYAMDRHDALLLINGKMLVKSYKSSGELGKWYQKQPFLVDTHKKILQEGEYKPIEVKHPDGKVRPMDDRRFVHILPS